MLPLLAYSLLPALAVAVISAGAAIGWQGAAAWLFRTLAKIDCFGAFFPALALCCFLVAVALFAAPVQPAELADLVGTRLLEEVPGPFWAAKLWRFESSPLSGASLFLEKGE